MNKRKILLLSMTLSLVAILAMGATLAYFTAEDEVENVITMGNVDIVLDEAAVVPNTTDNTWDAGDERVKANTYENVYPGAVLPKDPTVHNVGTYPAYVRVKVTVDFNKLAAMQADKVIFNGTTEDSDLTDIIDIDTTKWTYAGRAIDMSGDNRNVTYTYTLNDILAPDADATLFTEVTIPTFVTNEDVTAYGLQTFNVDLLAEAIQTYSFANADAAWAAFDGE